MRALPVAVMPQLAAGASPWKVSIFSKHLQWAEWKEMAAVAKEIGFDAIDLTLRKGGHVEPERVTEDLPKVTSIVRAAGLELSMVTTAISSAQSPHAETILHTAARLGIGYYRWGGLRYADDRPLPAQLDELRPKVAELAALSRQYGICGMYHTHSGIGEVGASMWDLWLLLKDADPRFLGFNYDIGHATVEGGYGGWIHSARLAAPLMRGVALKDFVWATNARGEWRPQWCPIGGGMVDFRRFFGMLRQQGFSGPIQLHYEYPALGGADDGRRTLTIAKKAVIDLLRRDLLRVREFMRPAA